MPSASYWWHPELGAVKEMRIYKTQKVVYKFLGWLEIKKSVYNTIKTAQNKIYGEK